MAWPNATLPNRRRELWNLVFLFYLKWVFLQKMEAVNTGSSFTSLLDRALPHLRSFPVSMLHWSPVDPQSSGSTCQAAVDIEDADTVGGEVATERTVPVPKLGLPPELAPGPSSR